MKFATRLRCKNFCTIVDDNSRYTWVIFIKNKSDFLEVFKTFYELAKTQLGNKLKIVRIDNANELSKGETLEFYKVREFCTKQVVQRLHYKWSGGAQTQASFRGRKNPLSSIKGTPNVLGRLCANCSTHHKQNALYTM